MNREEPRDLDGVINDVARGMTSTGLVRDLRPAVAARMAGAASSTLHWRVAVAAAAVAAAVVLAAVLMRPAPEEKRPPAVASAGEVHAAAPTPQATPAVAALEEQVAATLPRVRPVARQLVDDTPLAEPVVDIDPLAIVPLEEEHAIESTLSSQRVEIAPIDVERVSISELEQVE
jgi:hypothetical protein